MLSELKVPIPENDTDANESPFVMVGYGINAYFEILHSMMNMMIVLTCICLPIYFIYGQTDNGLWEQHSSMQKFMGRFSMGNMGGSGVSCNHIKLKELELQHMYMTCPGNSVIDVYNEEIPEQPVMKQGVLSDDMTSNSYCTENAIWSN